MMHTAELTAIAQARRTTVAELCNEIYLRLEDDSTDAPDGMVWEARIDYLPSYPTVKRGGYGNASGHIYATRSFGTLLATLHANGFLTGEHADDEMLASVRRVKAPR